MLWADMHGVCYRVAVGKTRLYICKPLPTWARQIRELRKRLQLSQAEFGKRLRCSSMTISRWERGLQKPPTRSLIAMGKLAGPRVGWFFWNVAGINSRDARAMLRNA